MTHPDEGVLQAYLDGEVVSEPREALDRHLAGCGDCRRTLTELDVLAGATRETLADIDVRTSDAEAAKWAVRRARAAQRSHVHRRRVAVAASVVLLMGAGWAAATPGSPLRRLWDPAVRETTTVAADQVVAASAADRSGVAVPSLDGALSVSFVGVSEGSWIEIRTAEGEDAVITAPAGSRFDVADGRARVEVDGARSELHVELPGEISTVEVRVDDQVVFRSVGGERSYPAGEPAAGEGGAVRLRIGAP